MRKAANPNQSSVVKAYIEFGEDKRMKPSSDYDRVFDVMEELVNLSWPTRDSSACPTDRYSERKETAEELSRRVNLPSAA